MKKNTLFLLSLSFLCMSFLQAQITSFPYTEDFESGDGGWVAANSADGTWALGTPAGAIINSAASGANAWVTNLTGDYNNNDDSAVVSPVFDFSALSSPVIEFSIWWNSEFSWDGLVLQSSIDGGTTWINVGSLNDPNNWYNDDSIGGAPGGQPIGWTGRESSNNGTNGWLVARNNIGDLGGESNVIFRFAFASDTSATDDGVAFDNITISQPTCPEPSSMSVASATVTSADLEWLAGDVETAWNVEWSSTGTFTPGNGEEEGMSNATGTPNLALTALIPSTNYFVYYQADCVANGVSPWVGPFSFFTGYCESVPSSRDGDGISQVQLGSELFTSGGDISFEDFTSPTVDLAAAITANLQITFIAGPTYVTNVWIDFNNNLEYDNANELVYQGESLAGNPSLLDASFVMPDVPLGLYNMRIVTTDFTQTPPNPCYNGTWGVTMDFTVNITEAPDCIPASALTALDILETEAELTWNGGASGVSWDLEWGLAGFTPGTGTPVTGLTTETYALVGLNAGTSYDFYVLSNCASQSATLAGPSTFITATPGGTCAAAFDMTVEVDCDTATPTTFDFANAEDIGANGENPSCDGFNNFGYWLNFTAPPVGSVVFNFGGDADGIGLEILDACGGTPVGTCLDNSLDSGDNSGVIGGLIPGNTYVAVIWRDGQSGTADVCIEEGPTCPFPIALDAINLTENSADLSWTENGTATSWNIEWGAEGFAQGTGTAINAVTTNPYNIAGLTQNTAYDYYIQAICGSEDSEFAGPFTFTTTPQTNFVLDCANDGPLAQDYCYDNGGEANPLIFTFSSNDGTPLNLTFNSGSVENGWDELVVLDSDGNPFLGFAAGDDNYGNAGDISGLTFQSAGDTVSFYINSDGTASCLSGSTDLISGINYTVSCATCISPAATSVVRQDCLNGPQFFVDVDVTDLGSATTLNITDNQGSTPQTTSALGIISFGPFANGTIVETTVVNANDANCSIITGDLTQDQCTVSLVDCASGGPLTQDYCYEDGGEIDPVIFTFISNDGTELNLNFNSGFIENGWDELVVLDSDGTPFPGFSAADENYGNNGDLTGLTFQSTGDTISFYINSDGVISCGGGSAAFTDGINYTVSCATCINPQVAFAVIDDCDNGEQFLIDVNIADLGDATSLTISNNINADTTPVTAPGTYQIGPFPFLTDVIVTVNNDQDANCVINSPAIQLLACPPANDNCDGAIAAVVNTASDCDNVTSGTILAATPSGVPAGSCAGTPNDDVWFTFEALDELQIISLINVAGGTFNIDHGLYEGSCGALTEVYCSDDDASVTPSLTVGNTYYIRVFSDGNDAETSTFDLCIRPAPNNIVCENAENFCSVGGALTTPNIIGIPSSGSIACLATAPNPTWNIIQIDDAGPIEIQIEQLDDNGVGLDVDFVVWGPFDSIEQACTEIIQEDCPTCPNNTTDPTFYPFGNIVDCSYSGLSIENLTIGNALSGEIYMLLVTNFNGNPGSITIDQTNGDNTGDGTIDATISAEIISNDVNFVDVDNDPTTPVEASVCGFTSVTIATDSPFADTFTWFKDGIVMEGEISDTIIVTESNNYQVQVFDSQCEVFADSQIVVINLYADAGPIADQNIEACDGADEDGTADFDLDALSTSLGLGADFTITYHTSEADANQRLGAVDSPYNSAGETLVIRVEDTDATTNEFFPGCRQLSEVVLTVNPIPTVNQPADFIVCDDIDGDVNGVTDFDLTSIDGEVSSDPNVVITYHTSQDAADDPDAVGLASPYSSAGELIFIRAENSVTSCFNTTSFNLGVNIVPLATFDPQYGYVVCPNATVPVTIGIIPDNFTDAEVSVSWLLDGAPIAGSGLTLNTVLLAGNYTAEITFNATGCKNTITAEVMELESCVIPQAISPGVSPGFNDNFDLSSYDVTKLEIFNRLGTLVYSKNDYIDEWVGQSNDGKELPVGTYFYTMEYEGGTKSRQAWIYINR